MSDETVFIATVTKGGGRGGRRYHTDADCRYLDQINNPREVDQEIAVEKMDLTECRVCRGERTTDGEPDFSVYRAAVEIGNLQSGGGD